nr:hypothetical protein Ccrd_000414 [Ipomoea batatas]
MKLVQSTTDIPNDPILTFAPPHLIRLKQAFLLQHVLIVVVIKGIRGHQIKGCQVSISGVIWTIPSSSVSKTGINLDISLSRLSKGLGRSMVRLAIVESLLPSFTVQDGPPTAAVASRAATDNTSAQDTIPGQAFSNSGFAASITS